MWQTPEKRVWIKAKASYWVGSLLGGLFRILVPAATIAALVWGVVGLVIIGTARLQNDWLKVGCLVGSIVGAYLAFRGLNWLVRGFSISLDKIWMRESEWKCLLEIHNNWVSEIEKSQQEGRKPPVRPY